jgi:hypothetical protein
MAFQGRRYVSMLELSATEMVSDSAEAGRFICKALFTRAAQQ